MIGDWLREWHEFSRPITDRSKAKSMQCRITFDIQFKLARNKQSKSKFSHKIFGLMEVS